MAYRTEKSGDGIDIVIDGWEKGIAVSPELGLGNLQSANITSVPGEVSVSPSMGGATIPPVGQAAISFSANAASDTFTVSSTSGWYNGMATNIATTSLPATVQSLVIGGGGGGGSGSNEGGGGGGGGFKYEAAHVLSNGIGSYPIVVGSGGAHVVGTRGSNGNSSSFDSIASDGGGGGGNVGNLNGANGASGGGAAANGTATGGIGISGEGTNGGNGVSGGAGGGGGATSAGANAINPGSSAIAGAGGAGIANSISGSSVAYSGGGGGGSVTGGTPGAAGIGGGGAGSNTGTATNGTANTGGGGGGNGNASGNGGDGASGVVIISYLTGAFAATGGTITTSGSNTIHTFTSNGTFIVTAINIIGGYTYYIGNLTPTTFKLYYDADLNQLFNILGNTTGTLDVPSFGTPVWSTQNNVIDVALGVIKYTFLLDTNGNCWLVRFTIQTGVGGSVPVNSIQYAGNIGHSSTVTSFDFGLVIFKQYLFVIIGNSIDYIAINDLFQAFSSSSAWVYGWKTDLSNTESEHHAISATDDAMYICNGSALASILEVSGAVFDPTDAATYGYNTDALTLPTFDQAQYVAQLGTQLLVGGILTYIYPWDRVSTSFNYPIICADGNIKRIVSTNSNAYVFAGFRGRIYITNGQQIQLYEKITDALSGAPEAYYSWEDALYLRNKLYFTFTATTNSGSTLSLFGGLWVLGLDAGQTQIDLSTAGSLFNSNQFSYGTYGGSCPVLFYNQLDTPGGYGICGVWVNGTTNGIDISSSTPYAAFQTVIQTDIIPIGTLWEQKTNRQFEYKLSKPLVTGESVRISWRGNLTDAFTVIPQDNGGNAGDISGGGPVNFQKQQWVQFQIELSSTATNPSYVRLREMRLR